MPRDRVIVPILAVLLECEGHLQLLGYPRGYLASTPSLEDVRGSLEVGKRPHPWANF
jgi:hypothetical protein